MDTRRKPGPKPRGDKAATGSERMAAYRARIQVEGGALVTVRLAAATIEKIHARMKADGCAMGEVIDQAFKRR